MVTKRVNGGTIGLQDRIKHFKKYYELVKWLRVIWITKQWK
jgi:predicted chitinase